MAEGFIDGATITSALTYLNLGRHASRPLWHQTSILETTYLLLFHDNIRIIPRPQGLGGERGDYAIATSKFSELIVDSKRRRAVFQATTESADSNYALVKSAWDQSLQDNNFQAWADLQRRDRWKNQTLTYNGLFDIEFVTTISKATGYDLSDVKRVLDDSRDPKKVHRWSKNIESSGDAKIANASWVIGGFMRGFFYDNLATVENLQLLTHPFRKLATRPLDITEQHEVTNTEEVLVKILIANALTETTKIRRVSTWAETVKKAREYVEKEKPDLSATTQPKAEEKAIDVARKIDLQGGPRFYGRLLNLSLSLAAPQGLILLTGFSLAPWVPVLTSTILFGMTEAINKTPGEWLADHPLKSPYQFRSLARSVPGRIERISFPPALLNSTSTTRVD